MDLKTVLGCLIALIGYSKGLLELNRFMAKRQARLDSRRAEHFDHANPESDDPDELFVNGDRRKFRQAIALLQIEAETKSTSIARLETQDASRAKELTHIRKTLVEIDERLQAKGI